MGTVVARRHARRNKDEKGKSAPFNSMMVAIPLSAGNVARWRQSSSKVTINKELSSDGGSNFSVAARRPRSGFLFAIVEIGGVPEIAPVLGIAEQTVKSHLHHIFEETGAKRQADLIKLVAAYSNPLSSQS